MAAPFGLTSFIQYPTLQGRTSTLKRKGVSDKTGRLGYSVRLKGIYGAGTPGPNLAHRNKRENVYKLKHFRIFPFIFNSNKLPSLANVYKINSLLERIVDKI